MRHNFDAVREFEKWYSGLKIYQGMPAKGTIAGALVVLERLKRACDLDIGHHTAKGQSQIIGAGRAAAKTILARFGETRPFLVEGGRTNRGLRGAIQGMLQALQEGGFAVLDEPKRIVALERMQRFLVDRIQEFHARERLEVLFYVSDSTYNFIHRLLAAAQEAGKHGPVAEYMVGAKLQLRFPQLMIENKVASAADKQRGRHGDFWMGNTVFHVTVSPGPLIFEKCAVNVKDGFQVYLLVPESSAVGAKQNAEQIAPEISVVSIEAFISQNIDELGEFDSRLRHEQISRLLLTYNKRVDAVESDKSLLIKIPRALQQAADQAL